MKARRIGSVSSPYYQPHLYGKRFLKVGYYDVFGADGRCIGHRDIAFLVLDRQFCTLDYGVIKGRGQGLPHGVVRGLFALAQHGGAELSCKTVAVNGVSYVIRVRQSALDLVENHLSF